MPSHGSAAGETGFIHLHSLVEQEVFCPIRFPGWGDFGLQNPLHSKAFAGKTNHAPWLRSRLLCEAELRTGCGSGLFLLDWQSFHLPELPKQEKIVLLKQKFIPLLTHLRRTPSIKRTTINHSLGVPCLGLMLSPDSPHAHPPTHIHTPVHA